MGKFENILIVSDIDETFLGTGGVIVQRNVDALRYFMSEGGKFTFATGRVHKSLLNTIPNAPEITSAPGIMSNGGYLYDFATETVINEKSMPSDVAKQVVDCIYDYNDEFGIRYSTPNGTVYCRMAPDYLAASESSYSGTAFLPRDQWKLNGCCKIVTRGRSEDLDTLRAVIEERFGGRVEIVKSGATFLEVLPLGCTKGSAISELREYYRRRGLEIKVYACGDYENDMAMLKTADVAVCPINAIDPVKAISDYILCHCSDGLIADLIEKLDA